MIHNTFYHSLFDQDFLSKDVLSLVQIKTDRVDDRDQNIHQWCALSAKQVLVTALVIISYYKVRDDGDGGSFYFVLKYF